MRPSPLSSARELVLREIDAVLIVVMTEIEGLKATLTRLESELAVLKETLDELTALEKG
jgi:prefoldin subunit 5